ncbi:hypothetical protein A1O3_01873 [Capronia epimyces CBS 606.96]|uniref:Uncharacterized protein n=1 Tax=Capronia epimyces CBS 606.96 TaxID=1182542 RepID=W9Z2R4_9EURO|nr:uncharacterized protein A1O3_01873 [Capronia epimyces CBS 606.96]EXJ88809.1 hypothetical protein A1O3_01873 [Capronia epimyces CBS 606.96]
MSCNTFSPDYSEAEHFEEPNSNIYYNDSEDGTNYEEDEAEPDGEDEFVQNEICQESIEIVIPPSRTFAVPESDVSDPDSYSSGEESSDAESPTSSPVGLSEETEDKDKTASTIPVLEVNKPQASPTSEQTRGTSVNHKPGDAVWLMDLSDEDDDVDVDDDDDDDDVGGLTQGDQGEPVVPTLLVTKPDYVQSSLPEGLESSSPLSQNAVGGSDRDEAVHTSCLCDIGTVKPSAEPFLAPPFIQDLQSDGADNLVSEEGRSSYAWAGHNSVLYEPVTGNFSQGTVRAPPITSNAPANPPSPVWPNDLNGNVWLPQFSSELQDQIPKGSVASQVDDSPKEGSAELSNRTLKRKAEQISSDATLQEQTVVAGSNSPNPANSISAVASDKAIDGAIDIHESNLQTSQLPGTEANDGTPLQNAELPPRKKIKRSKQRLNKSRGSSSSSLIKIAAATIAGMAIGTVGTIVGLASLPPDYFM